MPWGKRIVIDKEINDEWIDKLKNIETSKILKEKRNELNSIYKTIEKIQKESKKYYDKINNKYLDEKTLKNDGLLTLQEAYEYLTSNGMKISFRAFGGRVERKTIPSVKIGRKRYIPIKALNQLLSIEDEFYTVKEAFEKYKKYSPKMNLRAFIGRVEKGRIPSIKLGTKRLIPKVVVDALTEIRKNYYTVPEALEEIKKAGIRLKRSTLERRLDRRRIPFVKIGGKRYIPHDVVEELINKELELRVKK